MNQIAAMTFFILLTKTQFNSFQLVLNMQKVLLYGHWVLIHADICEKKKCHNESRSPFCLFSSTYKISFKIITYFTL